MSLASAEGQAVKLEMAQTTDLDRTSHTTASASPTSPEFTTAQCTTDRCAVTDASPMHRYSQSAIRLAFDRGLIFGIR